MKTEQEGRELGRSRGGAVAVLVDDGVDGAVAVLARTFSLVLGISTLATCSLGETNRALNLES